MRTGMEKEKENCERDEENSRSRRIIMTHLKDSIFSQLNHHPSLSTVDSSVIERRLRELFPAFRTPTHPPYAWMIESAIMGLNEETGSTKEAISEFIKREYNNNSDDLPLAHERILALQLERLCQVGEIACAAEGGGSGRYVLTRDSVNQETETKQQDEKGVILGLGLGVTRPRVLKVYARKKNQRRECLGNQEQRQSNKMRRV
ncbi:hypothetical protein AAZX31_17G176100 [Glycine max]|nr:HMG-Y-related protein A [Glycine max]